MKRSKPLSLDEIQYRLEKSGSESESNSTPIKVDTRSDQFVSPTIRVKKSDIHQIRRASFATHFWAENYKGGVKYLLKNPLSDDNFKQVLLLCGPDSKWKILDETFTYLQLKGIWNNASRDARECCGSRDTGFVLNGVHCNSLMYCPMEHCNREMLGKMDMDIMRFTPGKELCYTTDVIRDGAIKRSLFNENTYETNTEQSCSSSKTVNDDMLPMVDNLSESDVLDLSMTWDQQLSEDNDLSEEVSRTVTSPSDEKESSAQNYVSQRLDVVLQSVPNDDLKYPCEECPKIYLNFSSLSHHFMKEHQKKIDPFKKRCSICNAEVIHMDVHMKFKHFQAKSCEVCLQTDVQDWRVHRKLCGNKCRYCGKSYVKKDSVLKHMVKCEFKNQYQSEPLDLVSPAKKARIAIENSGNNTLLHKSAEVIEDVSCSPDSAEQKNRVDVTTAVFPIVSLNKQLSEEGKKTSLDTQCHKHLRESNSCTSEENLFKARTNFPFAKDSIDGYRSEYDYDDDEDSTRNRRIIKDQLELDLIRAEEADESELDDEDKFMNKFSEFMKLKCQPNDLDLKDSTVHEKGTPAAYVPIVRNYILKSISNVCVPFNPMWLIDGVTPKECKIDGQERRHVAPEEPIYLCWLMLEDAFSDHLSGNQERKILAATKKLMEFIEYTIGKSPHINGLQALTKVQSWHKCLENHIKNTGMWKAAKDAAKVIHEDNKVIKDMEFPNRMRHVLENFNKWLASSKRDERRDSLMNAAEDENYIPDKDAFDAHVLFVIEEIICCNGCRPCVLRRLPMKTWCDGKPGFNPKAISDGDCCKQESNGEDSLYRRIDPNIPPRHLACIHQIEDNSATCRESCPDEKKPDGVNLYVTFDKTEDNYWLHLPTYVKCLMDALDILRERYFKANAQALGLRLSYFEEDSTPFFLKSDGSFFDSLELKRLSEELGIDVASYDFRKQASSWGTSHPNEEVRRAEAVTLQHSEKVAIVDYSLSRQREPQMFTQTYVDENNFYSSKMMDDVQARRTKLNTKISVKSKARQEIRYQKLIQKKDTRKKNIALIKPLGPRNIILGTDKQRFFKLVESLTGSEIEEALMGLKLLERRDHVTKMVCSATGDIGQEMRELWVKMYRVSLITL